MIDLEQIARETHKFIIKILQGQAVLELLIKTCKILF